MMDVEIIWFLTGECLLACTNNDPEQILELSRGSKTFWNHCRWQQYTHVLSNTFFRDWPIFFYDPLTARIAPQPNWLCEKHRSKSDCFVGMLNGILGNALPLPLLPKFNQRNTAWQKTAESPHPTYISQNDRGKNASRFASAYSPPAYPPENRLETLDSDSPKHRTMYITNVLQLSRNMSYFQTSYDVKTNNVLIQSRNYVGNVVHRVTSDRKMSLGPLPPEST